MKNQIPLVRVAFLFAAALLFSGCESENVSTAPWRHYMSQGETAWSKGNVMAANTNYTLALSEAERFQTNSPRLISTLESLAKVRLDMGHYSDVEKLLQRRLSVADALGWTNTLECAAALGFLADVQTALGKFPEAEQALLKAHSILAYRNQPTPLYPMLSTKRARLYAIQKRYEAAEAAFEEARISLNYFERGSRPTSAQHGWSLSLIGDFYDDYGTFRISQKKYVEAEKMLRESISYTESQYGRNSGFLVYPLNHLAIAYAGQGNFAEAEKTVRRSLAIFKKKGITDHPALGYAAQILADILDHKVTVDPT